MKKGFKWYNNGVIEKASLECPEGWFIGRLPISEETRKKHSEHMKKITPEQWQLRTKKRQLTNQQKTEKEKQQRINKIRSTWQNKPTKEKEQFIKSLKTTWELKSEEEIIEKNNKISQALNNKSFEEKESRKQKIAEGVSNSFNTQRKKEYAQRASKRFKGREAWNKNKKMSKESCIKKSQYYQAWTPEKKEQFLQKQFNTKKQHNSFNTSQPEEDYYIYLKNKYGKENIIRQYKDSRYPFACDFYIKTEDLFIELNLHWTHGGHPFDSNNQEDILQLKRWEEKAKTSKFFSNAIKIWSQTDVEKLNILNKNSLNYKIFYNKEELYE